MICQTDLKMIFLLSGSLQLIYGQIFFLAFPFLTFQQDLQYDPFPTQKLLLDLEGLCSLSKTGGCHVWSLVLQPHLRAYSHICIRLCWAAMPNAVLTQTRQIVLCPVHSVHTTAVQRCAQKKSRTCTNISPQCVAVHYTFCCE